MNTEKQLVFPFMIENETDLLRMKIAEVRETADKALSMSDNVRRGIFKKHSDLARMFLQQQAEIDLLKAQMEVMKRAIK